MNSGADSRLAALAAYVGKHVPRYRGLSSFDQIPVVTKREIRADFAAHLSDELGSSAQSLLAFLGRSERPMKAISEIRFSERIVVEYSSGSSGLPFPIPKGVGERGQASLAIWRYRRACDPLVRPDGFCALAHPAVSAHHDELSLRRARGGRKYFYSDLIHRGCRWVHGTARQLIRDADALFDRGDLPARFPFVESSGYFLTKDDRRFLLSRMAQEVVDQYGCRETWVIGWRRAEREFSILYENVHVELLDRNLTSIVEPVRPGRIVVTSLNQRLLPFIRYDTGDFGEWAPGGIGSKLILRPDREHNLLDIHGQMRSGNEVFKALLIRVYRVIGDIPLEYIQIRYSGGATFCLVTSESPNTERLRSELESLCNRTRTFDHSVSFHARQLTDAEVAVELLAKPGLFKREIGT